MRVYLDLIYSCLYPLKKYGLLNKLVIIHFESETRYVYPRMLCGVIKTYSEPTFRHKCVDFWWAVFGSVQSVSHEHLVQDLGVGEGGVRSLATCPQLPQQDTWRKRGGGG